MRTLLVALLLIAACRTRPLDEPDASQPANRDLTGVPAGRIPGLCSDNLGPVVVHTSKNQVELAYIGRWLVCSPQGLAVAPHAGVEFKSNLRWILLDRNVPGTLVTTPGAGSEGGFNILDSTPYNGPTQYQTNFTYDSSGFNGGFAIFTTNPTGFTIDLTGRSIRYVATEE